MRLKDLYRQRKTYNYKADQSSTGQYKSQISPQSGLDLVRHDMDIPSQIEDKPEDLVKPHQDKTRITYRHDMDVDDYSEDHYEDMEYKSDTESGEMHYPSGNSIYPTRKDVRLDRTKDPNYPETERHRKEGGAIPRLPERSGNQYTPPKKIRHRRFLGFPGNEGGLKS